LVYIFLFLNFLRHQTMDKVQKYNSFNTNTPSSESYRNYLPYSPRSHTMQFLGFSNHEKGAPRQISKWPTACSTFSRSGWSVVRSTLLAKGGTSKKRLSLHFHKLLIQSNKASPWTFQMALWNVSSLPHHNPEDHDIKVIMYYSR
jgi:hypothetical protein